MPHNHNTDRTRTAKDDLATMAKLRKSLKQHQRREMQMRERAAKLTPSEIRAMNSNLAPNSRNSAQNALFKGKKPSTPSIPSVPSIPSMTPLSLSDPKSRPSQNATPPDSPTDSGKARQQPTSTACPPTPPQSPKPQELGSQPSPKVDHQPPQEHAHVHIHHPRPRETTNRPDVLYIPDGCTRRWSNCSVSSLSTRSLPMYRGHEMTHSGSISMLRRPSLDIVNNPLSMFSRPRQAIVNPAPDTRRTLLDLDPLEAQMMPDSTEAVGRPYEVEQIRRSRDVSPISMDEPRGAESQGWEEVSPISSLRNSIAQPTQEPPSPVHYDPEIQDTHATAVVVDKEAAEEEEEEKQEKKKKKQQQKIDDVPSKTLRMRFSLPSVFPGKKGQPTPEAVGNSKHSRSVAFIEPAEKDFRASGGTDIAKGPNSNPSSSNVSFSTEASSCSHATNSNGHVNVFAPTGDKNKPLTALSIPKAPPAVYGRCKCCGKLKRPATFSAELSPVLENENLRTNLNFAIEKTQERLNGMPDGSPTSKRYTPILPLEVLDGNGTGRTVRISQASIEPPLGEDQLQPKHEPVPAPAPCREKEEVSLVRFASLHRVNDGSGQRDHYGHIKDEVAEVKPVVDPLIKPTGYTPIPMVHHDWEENKDSCLGASSTASIEPARPVSMPALKLLTSTDPKRAKSARPSAVDDDCTETNASEPPAYPISRPLLKSSPRAEKTTTTPSEAAVSGQSSKPRARSSLVEEWYMNAIREGPKQDVITVVGWDHHRHKAWPRQSGVEEKGEATTGSTPQRPNTYHEAVRPPVKFWPLPETKLQQGDGGRTKEKSLEGPGDNRRHSSSILTPPISPVKKDMGKGKRRSMLLGLF